MIVRSKFSNMIWWVKPLEIQRLGSAEALATCNSIKELNYYYEDVSSDKKMEIRSKVTEEIFYICPIELRFLSSGELLDCATSIKELNYYYEDANKVKGFDTNRNIFSRIKELFKERK